MIKLYNAALSPFAARVRMALYFKGIDWEDISPPGGLKSEEYLDINPAGRIPVLALDNGYQLPESEVIVEYLEDLQPEPSLRPKDAEQGARARVLARICDFHVAEHMRPLFGQLSAKDKDQAIIKASFANIDDGLRYIEAQLQPGPWALGADMSTADCALVPILFFVEMLGGVFGVANVFDAHDKVSAYWATAKSQPLSVKVLDEIQKGLAEYMASQK
ncbi:MAG: glutathione S-transferase [Robiginitomaculum sp.]|nr:MAG: glutathione S-transferase [Robiginitomaculum sp.]